MNKVKIFNSVSIEDLEFQINQFITGNSYKIINISISTSQVGILAALIYQEVTLNS